MFELDYTIIDVLGLGFVQDSKGACVLQVWEESGYECSRCCTQVLDHELWPQSESYTSCYRAILIERESRICAEHYMTCCRVK